MPGSKGINKHDQLIETIPDHLKTQEMCNEAVDTEPLSLLHVPDHFKTQEMCDKVVRNKLFMLLFVPDHLWTQGMCNEVMRTKPNAFHRIPYHFKMKCLLEMSLEMSIKTVGVLLFCSLFQITLRRRGYVIRQKEMTLLLCSLSLIGLLQGKGLYMWHDDYYDDGGQ